MKRGTKRFAWVAGIFLLGILVFLFGSWPGSRRSQRLCDKRIVAAVAAANKTCDERVATQKAVKETRKEVAKPVKKRVVKRPVARTTVKAAKIAPPLLVAAPTPAPLPVIPRATALETERLTLRLNIVEWSDVFQDKSLAPRDIGPIIREGLQKGTVRRTTAPLTFNVNGAIVKIQNGQAVLDPGPLGEIVILIEPLGLEEFVLPPGAQFPLTIAQGELKRLAEKGIKDIWVTFILAPSK